MPAPDTLKWGDAKERRLALKLWTLFHLFVKETNGSAKRLIEGRLNGACEITSDLLGYGMAPAGVHMAVAETYSKFVTDNGAIPAATSGESLQAWREGMTDATVEAIRGLR